MSTLIHLQNEVKHLRNLLKKYKQYSFVDILTGLYNRRKFDNDFRRLNSLHKRYGNAYSIIFIDLNKFKYYNDHFGHSYGDKILNKFAKHLKKVIRKTDRVYRYGGDEFACILHGNTDKFSEDFYKRLKNTEIAFSYAHTNINININKVDKLMYEQKKGE